MNQNRSLIDSTLHHHQHHPLHDQWRKIPAGHRPRKLNLRLTWCNKLIGALGGVVKKLKNFMDQFLPVLLINLQFDIYHRFRGGHRLWDCWKHLDGSLGSSSNYSVWRGTTLDKKKKGKERESGKIWGSLGLHSVGAFLHFQPSLLTYYKRSVIFQLESTVHRRLIKVAMHVRPLYIYLASAKIHLPMR